MAGFYTTPVQFVARPGAIVTGRVLTPAGHPAVNAMLVIGTAGAYSVATYREAKTAADGRFRICGLATGSYGVYQNCTGVKAWLVEPLEHIALTEGKETTVPDLHAHTGAILQGTVVDADSGVPLPLADISLCYGAHVNGEANYQCNGNDVFLQADQSGHYRFCATPGRVRLLGGNPRFGYPLQRIADVRAVNVREGETVTLTVKVHKGHTVTGTVVDGDGIPVPGVKGSIKILSMENGGACANEKEAGFTTDRHGKFAVSGLPAYSGTITLDMDYEHHLTWAQPAPLTIKVPVKGPVTIRVKRISLCSVRGRVVDTRRRPLAGVTARFEVACLRQTFDPRVVNFPGKRDEGMSHIYTEQLTAITAADGSYHLAGLPPGVLPDNSYLGVGHTAGTSLSFREGSRHLEVFPNRANVTLFSIGKAGYRQLYSHPLANKGKDTMPDAVMVASTTTVRGKVRDPRGQPVAGATVVSVEGGLCPRRLGCGGRFHAFRAAGRQTAPGRRHAYRRRAGYLSTSPPLPPPLEGRGSKLINMPKTGKTHSKAYSPFPRGEGAGGRG